MTNDNDFTDTQVGHRRDMGQTETKRRDRSDRSFQWARLNEPMAGVRAIAHYILRNLLEQSCFRDRGVPILQ
jgi:hypothetical protein